MADNKNKLSVNSVFHKFEEKQVLNDISFDVSEGEFLSILGPSGCGKTTLLRILIGLLKPTGGQIIKDGEDITAKPASERGMGIVFQNYALFENMTVFGNIEYALKIQNWWDRMSQKYNWESDENGHWEINFETCEIILVTHD